MRQVMVSGAFALALVSLAYDGAAQQRASANPQEWIEVVPERKSLMDAKRIRKFDEGLVLEVVLVRDGNFFGKDVIHAQGFVSNPTKKLLKGTYYVALFDKDKRLVGCQGLSMMNAVKPGEKDMNLSVVIEGPKPELDKVKFAQYRWYVAEPGPDDK